MPDMSMADEIDRMYYHHHRNIRYARDQLATQDTAAFVQEWFSSDVREFTSAIDVMSFAMEMFHCNPNEGDRPILEFGVATGGSLRDLSCLTDNRVIGFDSFQGLPENWKPGYDKGAFAQTTTPKLPPNAYLEIGMFADTLPAFLEHDDGGPYDFIHIDCDLYSSTKTVLSLLKESGRLLKGCVILFDEYFNYPGWRNHEHKALLEVLGGHFEYKAYNYLGEQVVVQLT